VERGPEIFVSRTTRVVISLIVMAALTAMVPKIADVVAAIVWIFLFFGHIVSDVSSGPPWVNWLLYLPTVAGYVAIGVCCVVWIRSAPSEQGR
jgi:hypothetical protein